MKKTEQKPTPSPKKKEIDKEKQRREAENFKRKYFDFYDDVKISVKEDW